MRSPIGLPGGKRRSAVFPSGESQKPPILNISACMFPKKLFPELALFPKQKWPTGVAHNPNPR